MATWLTFFLAFLFTALPCACVSAQAAQSAGMTLLGSWDDPTLAGGSTRYNDVWGYAADNREFALIGSRHYVHILEVTDPTNISELHRINFSGNLQSSWRDIKIYDNYAYCVTETSEGMHVISLAGLTNTPSTVSIVHSDANSFTSCHNIVIDYESSPVKLYAFGTDARRNGYQVFSLADPAHPALLASRALSNGGYIHDGYAIRDTLYANHESRGMYVYAVDDGPNDTIGPIELGLLNNYQEEGYNHSVWRTPSGQYAVMCDETANTGVKIVDVSDPLDMQVVGLFRSTLNAPNSVSSLAHNPLVINDAEVVLSYYGDGIQIWEFSDPANPTRVAYYDTTPNSSSYTNGVWGAYPFLPSGNILGSDMTKGLFVVQRDRARALPVTYANWQATNDGKNALLNWTVATQTSNQGWTVEHAAGNNDFSDIGWVPAGAHNQQFFHQNPGPGIHYYQLRQRDFDGTETLSEVRAVTFTGGELSAQTFPNPSTAGSELTFTGLNEDSRWSVWSINGQQLHQGQGRTASLKLPAGTYLLRVGHEVVDRLVIK